MNNGSNEWGVRYSHIKWLDRLLANHPNLSDVERHDDLVFEVNRIQQCDHLAMLCCNEYTMGLTFVQRAISEFGPINIIYVGGGWCGYTEEAKEFCVSAHMGLFVTDEMTGAIWRDEYWSYFRRDEKGSPIYHHRDG